MFRTRPRVTFAILTHTVFFLHVPTSGRTRTPVANTKNLMFVNDYQQCLQVTPIQISHNTDHSQPFLIQPTIDTFQNYNDLKIHHFKYSTQNSLCTQQSASIIPSEHMRRYFIMDFNMNTFPSCFTKMIVLSKSIIQYFD